MVIIIINIDKYTITCTRIMYIHNIKLQQIVELFEERRYINMYYCYYYYYFHKNYENDRSWFKLWPIYYNVQYDIDVWDEWRRLTQIHTYTHIHLCNIFLYNFLWNLNHLLPNFKEILKKCFLYFACIVILVTMSVQ